MSATNAQLRLEMTDVSMAGIDPVSGSVPPLIRDCVLVLDLLAVHPSSARLVIADDFVGSVQARLGASAAGYTTARATGMVAGKTMQLADGTVDVVLPAWMFDVSADVDADERARLVLRTAIHEAGHVAMIQAGEKWTDPGGQRIADRSFRSTANSVIEEYRAELGVYAVERAGSFGGIQFGPQDWDYLELVADFVLKSRAADDAYQVSLDVYTLMQAIGGAAVEMWRVFAYLAASLRETDFVLPAGVTEHELWRRIADEHWEQFQSKLSELPPSSQRLEPESLDQITEDLDLILRRWMFALGFDLRDVEGNTEFLIVEGSILVR